MGVDDAPFPAFCVCGLRLCSRNPAIFLRLPICIPAVGTSFYYKHSDAGDNPYSVTFRAEVVQPAKLQ